MHYHQPNYPNHHQPPYPNPHKEDPKITKLRQDNIQLQKALQQLNECYQQKISLLQQQLKHSRQKQQALLEWKSSYIDKELFNNAKYEQELQKLLSMIEQMTTNYQKDQAEFKAQLEEKQEEMSHLKDQNHYLRQQKQTQELKIQTLAQKYIVQIERLNTQLKQLKEEVNSENFTQTQIQYTEIKGESLTFKEENLTFKEQNLTFKEENLTFKESMEIHLSDQKGEEDCSQRSVIDQNWEEGQEEGSYVVKGQTPLKDISNKNGKSLEIDGKSSLMKGAITIHNKLGQSL